MAPFIKIKGEPESLLYKNENDWQQNTGYAHIGYAKLGRLQSDNE